jgi:hypothetical protein
MHPSAQAVMSYFQAFAQGGTATMRALFADDATRHRRYLERDDDTLDSIVQVSACVLYHGLWGRRYESAEDPGTRPGSSLASCLGTREA